MALVLAVVYYRHSLQKARFHPVRRPLENDPSRVVDGQMLQGKFGSTVPAQEREIVESALKASDQSNSTSAQSSQINTNQGTARIILTQPLGTTVEDTEPTLTWDTPFESGTYQVHIEDRDSHQTAATSASLDEGLWQVSTPLARGRTYLWRVDASIPGNHSARSTITSAQGQFSVLSDDGEQKLRDARLHNPSHLLLGSLYTHYEMWPEAVLEYRKLVSEVPDSAQATKLLRNAESRSSAARATP